MWKTLELTCLRFKSEVFLVVSSIGTTRNTVKMRFADWSRLALVVLTIGLLGIATLRNRSQEGHEQAGPKAESKKLAMLRRQAFEFYSAQQYEEAIPVYLEARSLALKEGNDALAVQFLNNIASNYFSVASYQQARKYYRQAVLEARGKKLPQLETMAAYNVASIHLSLGESREALAVIREFPLDGSSMGDDSRLDGFLLQGNIFTRLKMSDEANSAFGRALAEADREPPLNIRRANEKKIARWPESLKELRRAWVLGVMAQSLVWREKFAEAETYTLEAFRLRSIFQEKARLRDALQLAMLLRNRGDFPGALGLLKVARSLDPGNRTPMHLFMIDREEARIHLAGSKSNLAMPFLRSALAESRRWRLQVLPSDSSYLSFESYLTNEVHAAFLGAIADPAFPLNESGIAAESFWVAEEARFASMRAAQFPSQDFASRFPPAYWQKLARFQSLQANAMRGKVEKQDQRPELELELRMLEVEAGLLVPSSSVDGRVKIRDWQRGLPKSELIFSYYLSEPYSLAWIVDCESIKMRRIAGKKEIERLVEKFRSEVSNPSQKGTASTGLELSQQLFGEYLSTKRTTPIWTMVLDQQLSSLPIGALPTGHQGTRYLVEEHSLRVLPSAIFLRPFEEQEWQKTATGIGDPVYNKADVRVSPLKNVSADLLQLSRLPASTQELRQSMSVLRGNHWTTDERTGVSATVTTLRSTLEQSPDILHLSTHFVPQAENAHFLSIGLSPEKDGNAVFSALDLNSVRTRTKLVVLSGCNSSTGEIVPGIGINGLSRAFLISGVSTVVATLWPTLDTEGPIFPVFYANLMIRKWSSRAAAEALRNAQLEMIRQGGWTSKPAYWAAYIAISKG